MLGATGDVKAFDVGAHSTSRAACRRWRLLRPDRLPPDGAHRPKRAGHGPRRARLAESQLVGAIRDHPDSVPGQPVTYVTKDDPPFLIVHGAPDALSAPQSVLLDEALRKPGAVASSRSRRPHGGETTRQGLPMALEFLRNADARESSGKAVSPDPSSARLCGMPTRARAVAFDTM